MIAGSPRHFARRKGTRVLCARCGRLFGQRMPVLNVWYPPERRPASQANLTLHEERALLEETIKLNSLPPERRILEYEQRFLPNEWRFGFTTGWIQRGDIWVLSTRAKQRVKKGKHPFLRRPQVVDEDGTRRHIPPSVERLPLVVECPQCELVQRLDRDKLGITYPA